MMKAAGNSLPPPIPCTVLRGHQDAVNAIEFLGEEDADDATTTKLLSGAADGELKVWDLSIKRPTVTIKGHLFPVLSVHTLGGSKIGSSGRDAMFKVWDINATSTDPLISILTGCEHFCGSAANCGNIIATPDSNSQILLWDIREIPKSPVLVLRPDSRVVAEGERVGMVTSIHMTSQHNSGDNQAVVFGGYEDGSIIQYDIRNGERIREHKKGLDPILAMDVKPSWDAMVFGGGDETLTKLAAEDNKTIFDSTARFLETHTATLAAPGTSSIKFRRDGRLLVSGHWDHTLRIFDQKKLKPLAIIGHHSGGVYSVAFNKGSAAHIFASASKDKTIALWDLFAESMR